MKMYKSYTFRTKDPVIDELRTLIEDTNGAKVNSKALGKLEKDGGPTRSCMHGWFFGPTRRPQSASVEAAGRSLGFKRTWVRLEKK